MCIIYIYLYVYMYQYMLANAMEQISVLEGIYMCNYIICVLYIYRRICILYIYTVWKKLVYYKDVYVCVLYVYIYMHILKNKCLLMWWNR
jgi:hypothetical protein